MERNGADTPLLLVLIGFLLNALDAAVVIYLHDIEVLKDPAQAAVLAVASMCLIWMILHAVNECIEDRKSRDGLNKMEASIDTVLPFVKAAQKWPGAHWLQEEAKHHLDALVNIGATGSFVCTDRRRAHEYDAQITATLRSGEVYRGTLVYESSELFVSGSYQKYMEALQDRARAGVVVQRLYIVCKGVSTDEAIALDDHIRTTYYQQNGQHWQLRANMTYARHEIDEPRAVMDFILFGDNWLAHAERDVQPNGPFSSRFGGPKDPERKPLSDRFEHWWDNAPKNWLGATTCPPRATRDRAPEPQPE